MTKEQAIHNFWSSFDLPAYDENTVPDNMSFPYITYDVVISDFNNSTAMSGSIWYKSTSWKDITDKLNEISEHIGLGGKIKQYDDGALWIKKGSPFAQRMRDDSNDLIRRIYINIEAEYISEI